jgi:hypothetical protein
MTPGEPRRDQPPYRHAAIAILAHVLLLYAAFTVLGVVFDFPDVLRRPAAERLGLFQQVEGVVRPVYGVLTLTGFTQVVVAVMLYQAFRERGGTPLMLGLVFGVVAGVLQALGYVRWVVLTPYLARALADPAVPDVTRQAIALAEGSFNRYGGMAVGEHLATLAVGVWILCLGIAMRRDTLFDRRLGSAGIALTPLAALLALEPLGVVPRLAGPLVTLAFPAWVVWLVVIAASLWRTDPATGAGPRLTWRTAAWAGPLFVLLAAPMLVA